MRPGLCLQRSRFPSGRFRLGTGAGQDMLQFLFIRPRSSLQAVQFACAYKPVRPDGSSGQFAAEINYGYRAHATGSIPQRAPHISSTSEKFDHAMDAVLRHKCRNLRNHKTN